MYSLIPCSFVCGHLIIPPGILIDQMQDAVMLWMLQEFLDARDADDARHYTNGKDLDGSRLIVEFARRVSIMDINFF
jgi:hypothetical protein